MAKKKARRSANVARKREKRNRDRKSRQKQIAVEKQRRLPYEKSEKERLHACISQSRELLNEPELENVHFDFELMYTWVTELLEDYEMDGAAEEAPSDSPEEASEELVLMETPPESQISSDSFSQQDLQMQKAERACEHFRTEVLPHLVTPEFMQRLIQALTACETRLKLIGNRDMAEVALVARSLFEVAPTEMLVFHPLIQTIGIQTLRMIVEEPDVAFEGREDVKEILSDVLEYETESAASYASADSLSLFSDAAAGETPAREDDEETPDTPDEEEAPEEPESPPVEVEPEPVSEEPEEPEESEEPEEPEEPESPPEPEPKPAPEEEPPTPTFTPDELAARALYKNFEGMATREIFEGTATFVVAAETETQIEFVDVERELYITLTEERLQLHARSEEGLIVAMEEIQEVCEEALMYLAKTIQS